MARRTANLLPSETALLHVWFAISADRSNCAIGDRRETQFTAVCTNLEPALYFYPHYLQYSGVHREQDLVWWKYTVDTVLE